MSWARDPGSGIRTTMLTRLEADATSSAWMAQRGPLPPDSLAACVLYDFERAVSQLPLFEQGIIALSVMGFSPQEIAALIDPDRVITMDTVRRGTAPAKELDRRRKRIRRRLFGSEKRDAEGKTVRDENDNVVYAGGVVPTLTRLMNEPPRQRSEEGSPSPLLEQPSPPLWQQEVVREKGMCGALVVGIDGREAVCILEPGHDNGAHGEAS